MTANELTVDDGWQEVGRIMFDPSTQTFQMPAGVPDVPGLYKLTFANGRVYLGEAGDLHRRLGDYLVYYEATGIESEFRINQALKNSGWADMAIYIGNGVISRSERCQIEHRLIKAAGERSLNGGTVEEKIAFHAAEIIRLTKKLNSRTSNGGAH